MEPTLKASLLHSTIPIEMIQPDSWTQLCHVSPVCLKAGGQREMSYLTTAAYSPETYKTPFTHLPQPLLLSSLSFATRLWSSVVPVLDRCDNSLVPYRLQITFGRSVPIRWGLPWWGEISLSLESHCLKMMMGNNN